MTLFLKLRLNDNNFIEDVITSHDFCYVQVTCTAIAICSIAIYRVHYSPLTSCQYSINDVMALYRREFSVRKRAHVAVMQG